MTMTTDDESILKSALAFVVLKRRLKAKQQGLSSSTLSSSLPYLTSTSSQSLSKSQELEEDKGHTSGNVSGKSSHCGSTKTKITIDPYPNNNEQIIEKDSEEHEVLPFLNGKLSHNGRTNRSNNNNSTSCQKHLETMLQVAKSTSLSLYSSKMKQYFCSSNDDRPDSNQSNNNDDDQHHHRQQQQEQQEQHDQQLQQHHPSLSKSSSFTSSKSTTATNIITSSSSSTTTSATTTTSSSLSLFDPSQKYSIIYDYKTASNKKIIPSTHNHSSSSSPSYYHTYAVLDGILLHITCTLRTASNTTSKRFSPNYNRMQTSLSTSVTSCQNSNHHDHHHIGNENHPPSFSILLTFMIQNLLQPLVSITSIYESRISSSSSSKTTLMMNQKQYYIQNILSTCTILHRLVLFDTSLSFYCIIGICKILKLLYYNGGCGGVTYLGGSNMTHGSTSSENGGDYIQVDGDDCDGEGESAVVEGEGEYADIINVLLDGYTKQQANGNNEENNPIEDINIDSVEQKCHSIQVQDVATVNILILLEQIIGMSILLLTDHSSSNSSSTRPTSTTPATTQSKDGWIGDILSILSVHLGPELMIPVSTNDMARLYVIHERQSHDRHNNYKMKWNGNHQRGSGGGDDHDKQEIELCYGLNVGAKMMLRLYIYDIVQKLSFHNNA
jgi:hypothetical protein